MSILADTVPLEHAHTPARARAADRVWSRTLLFAAAAIVVVAPFERPLFTVGGGLTVTTSEAATSIALVVAAFYVTRRQIVWPAPLMLPGSAFVAAMVLAALAAPMEQGNALRFAARMLVAAIVCVLFVNVVMTTQRARAIVRVALGIAALVGAIAVLEQAEVPAVLAGLTAFRPGFHVVAGQMRATSTLIYPTIASMYLEVVFALGLWLLLDPVSRRPRLERSLVFAALVAIGAGISATFTRAGLIGMFVSMIVVAGFRMLRVQRAQWNVRPMATLGVVLAAVVVVMHSVDLLAVRLGTEGSQAWYGAQYRVPPTLQLKTGATHSIPIVVTNTGRLTWDSAGRPPFAMAYHWLRADSDAVIQFDGERTPFARPVRPGETVRLPVTVVAPGEAGNYVLVWDVVHETRAWLSTESVAPARTMVSVTGAKSGTVVTRMSRLPIAPIRLTRPELWGIALQLSAERPWLGVGPDNFRHAYGRYAGSDRWDPRVHANNMYLETLTGAGIIGLLALVWLGAASGSTLWRGVRQATETSVARKAAVLAAWLMIAGHGLVDSFLSFTTTYLTFAMALGLAFSPGLTGLAGSDADRI